MLSYFIFFFNHIWLSNEYTFQLCIFQQLFVFTVTFFIVDCLIVLRRIVLMILVPYVFLIIACIWKLEIKVLLYLPVSQPPTVTMVLVSIKKILVLSVYAVLLRYVIHRSMFMHDIISQANRCSWVEQIETMREQRN